jgi:hypothetical protein
VSVVADSATVLWPRRDRSLLAALGAFGFGLLAVSWLGVSGTTRFSTQVAWANVGGAGLLAVMVGCALRVHAGRRQVARRLNVHPFVRRPAAVSGSATVALDRAESFVWAAGMSRYHRSDCPAVAGKSVTSAGADAHWAEGRLPCGMCEP